MQGTFCHLALTEDTLLQSLLDTYVTSFLRAQSKDPLSILPALLFQEKNELGVLVLLILINIY